MFESMRFFLTRKSPEAAEMREVLDAMIEDQVEDELLDEYWAACATAADELEEVVFSCDSEELKDCCRQMRLQTREEIEQMQADRRTQRSEFMRRYEQKLDQKAAAQLKRYVIKPADRPSLDRGQISELMARTKAELQNAIAADHVESGINTIKKFYDQMRSVASEEMKEAKAERIAARKAWLDRSMNELQKQAEDTIERY